MAVTLALYVLFLYTSFIRGFILFNNREVLWPAESYYDNGEKLAFKTTNKSSSECTSKFCKFAPEDNSQEDPLILTPFIKKEETEKARNLSKVDPTLFAGINSHAAYFTVNETNKWNLFFWYFPAQEVVLENTPLIIWLQGGPGGSSMFGLFEEIGPIQIKNGTVVRRTINWGSNYSLLFIDNPVGTGFSFTENHERYATNEDMVGECLLNFLQQFLQVFPELRKAPLFIAGESYAGKYIPAFGHYIHRNKNNSMPINLKGLAIGNGWIDPATQAFYSEWALQVGLIDPEQAKKIHVLEENAKRCWDKHEMNCFMENARDAFTTLKVLAPVSSYNYIKDSTENINNMEFARFLNEPTIQKALHVKIRKYYPMRFDVYAYLYHTDLYYTVKPWLEELLEYYGVMCYSGQLDVIVAYAISVHTYQSLNWSGQQAYLNATRVPLYDETDPAKVNSFVKASGNFQDVMVRSAGHMVPTDQPRAAKQIIDMFIKKFK